MKKPATARPRATVRPLTPTALAAISGGGDTLKMPELAGDTTKTPFNSSVWQDDWLAPV